MAETGFRPTLFQDEETKAFYAVFPESKEISTQIEYWRNGNPVVDIHAFLLEYEKLRNMIKLLREVKKNGTES